MLPRKLTSGFEYLKEMARWGLLDRGFKLENKIPNSPKWLEFNGDVITLTHVNNDRPRVAESDRPNYYFALEETEGGEITLDPDYTFDTVRWEQLDLKSSSKFECSVHFETSSGEEKIEKVSFKNGVHNDGNRMPVAVSIDEPAERARIKQHSVYGEPSLFERVLFKLTTDTKLSYSSTMSVPTVTNAGKGFPIFIVSVDTFRHDFLNTFSDVVDALGDDVIIPTEPRTQGHWTPASHGAIFSGTHPATHGFLTPIGEERQLNALNQDVTLLPEILTENGYLCSACGMMETLSPRTGFGRGVHRWSHKPMGWGSRTDDSAEVVNQAIKWISESQKAGIRKQFHFLHLYGPHIPYFPPDPLMDDDSIDFELIDQYRDATLRKESDYVQILRNDPYEFPDSGVEEIIEYYERSLRHVSQQLVRLVDHLKRVSLFEDAIIIILGDHGEDFLEAQFAGHQSLTDENLRPGMVIKPPSSVNLTVPDEIDYVDIAPTIADLVDADDRAQFAGQSIRNRTKKPRITERLSPQWYSVAVENDGVKAIFTYPENYPNRPTNEQIDHGPVEIECFVFRGPDDRYEPADVDDIDVSGLNSIAQEFIRSRNDIVGTAGSDVSISKETQERLETLGYR